MNIERLLIVRGVKTTDQLQQLGLPMAERFAGADVVALVGDDGRGLVVKGSKTTTIVDYVDADSSAGRCMRAIRRVKDAYESRDVVGNAPHDMTAEQVVGMLLFYWPDDPQSVGVVADAVERGDGAAVERAADAFIAADFGASLGSPDTLRLTDEHSDDAAGHAANEANGAPG